MRDRKALVAELPLGRLLTETDGPFTQADGRPAEPDDVGAAVVAIAAVRGLSAAMVSRAVRQNLQILLRSPPAQSR